MDLTSWRRVRYFLGSNDVLADDPQTKRTYLNFIPAISKRVEQYLGFNIESASYTKYRDSLPNTLEYFFDVYPITAITSVHSDPTGEYDGSQSAESDYYIGVSESSIVLQTVVTPAKRGLKFIFTGGLASHGTQSQYTLTSVGSVAFTAGKFVYGASSDAIGYVVSLSGVTLTVEVLYGTFITGETIHGRTTEDGDNITNMNATLNAKAVTCLAESYPDIVTACELEIRYMHKHRSDYEIGINSRGESTKKDLTQGYDFLPEVRSLLDTYRRITI